MKCETIREQLLDLAGGKPTAEQAEHLAACPACAGKLAELRQTMSLLDAWQAPEGSAVADLQALDKNADLLADFDLMEEVAQQPNQVQQQ